jgi:hypothetical protein
MCSDHLKTGTNLWFRVPRTRSCLPPEKLHAVGCSGTGSLIPRPSGAATPRAPPSVHAGSRNTGRWLRHLLPIELDVLWTDPTLSQPILSFHHSSVPFGKSPCRGMADLVLRDVEVELPRVARPGHPSPASGRRTTVGVSVEVDPRGVRRSPSGGEDTCPPPSLPRRTVKPLASLRPLGSRFLKRSASPSGRQVPST